MKRVIMVAIAMTACGDDQSPPANAPILWLALDGRETDVRLVEKEPDPF